MAGLTWLHLSDWHQKSKGFDRQVVLDALIKDIEGRIAISTDLDQIDFIVFSGDVACSGKPDEYQAAKEVLFEPLLGAAGGLSPDQLFIVPGNHDLNRDDFELLPEMLLKPLDSDSEVKNWLVDKRKRAILLQPFNAFTEFVADYTHQDKSDYACIRRLQKDDKKIALLCLNSSWMCGRNKDSSDKVDDEGYALVGEPQIHEPLMEISDADIKIAIFHHPFEWLNKFDRRHIQERLTNECDFILSGHQHMPDVRQISKDHGFFVHISTGASYKGRISKDPLFINAYNLVHFDLDTKQGVVFLRRWSDRKNRWIDDTDTFPGGKVSFGLSKELASTLPIPAKSDEKMPITAAESAEVIIPRQIPSPPPDFKGREEDIAEILSNFDKGATITGLHGMPGVGKTAFAQVLAERLKGRFPDGQILLNLRGTSNNPMSPAEAMAQVIHAYHPIDPVPDNQDELRGRYLSVLSGKSTLLLLDNAANREQVEQLLPPTSCAVLITSRTKFTLPGLKEKDLYVLPPDKARELLLAIADRIGNRAGDLAKLCGYLPLALRNAGSALAERRDLDVAEYERRLQDKRARLELVEASFSLSYDLLSTTRRKQWCRLSVFPEDFERDGARAVFKMAPEPSSNVLSDLVKWSLVDFIQSTNSGEGRYKLHDLARLFAESRLDPAEHADAQQHHAKYYMKEISDADKLYEKGGKNTLPGLNLFDREWANIKTGQAWAESMMKATGKNEKKSDMKFALQMAKSYPNDGAHILSLRLHPQDWIRWLEIALTASRKTRDSGSECVHLGNLGNAYSNLGEARKAIEYYNRARTITRKIGDRRNEGANLGNLGLAYSNLGEVRKAIEYYDQALAISREIGDRRVEGNQLGNLGNAYSDLGEVRKAIEYHDQALAISREIGDRRGEGARLGNLGNAYSNLGEVRKAIEYHDQALAISREIGDRRGEGARLGNLGNAYSDLGKVRKAIEYHDQALAISREIGDRSGEGNQLGNLGNAYLALGEVRKAIEYYDQALAISREIGDRRDEGADLGNLGNAYSDLGEVRKAIEYYDQALAISREIGDRRGEGADLGNLGNAYSNLGDVRKAIEYHDQALAISREIGDRRGEGNHLGDLGLAYSDLGEVRKAIEYYDQALAIAHEIGVQRKEGEMLCYLGKAYANLGETDKAIGYCMQSSEISHNIENRRIEGEALCNLGRAYAGIGEVQKAIEQLELALEITRKIEYRKTEGESLFNMSLALDKLGCREEAIDNAKAALAIFEKIESPLAEKARKKLAEWHS